MHVHAQNNWYSKNQEDYINTRKKYRKQEFTMIPSLISGSCHDLEKMQRFYASQDDQNETAEARPKGPVLCLRTRTSNSEIPPYCKTFEPVVQYYMGPRSETTQKDLKKDKAQHNSPELQIEATESQSTSSKEDSLRDQREVKLFSSIMPIVMRYWDSNIDIPKNYVALDPLELNIKNIAYNIFTAPYYIFPCPTIDNQKGYHMSCAKSGVDGCLFYNDSEVFLTKNQRVFLVDLLRGKPKSAQLSILSGNSFTHGFPKLHYTIFNTPIERTEDFYRFFIETTSSKENCSNVKDEDVPSYPFEDKYESYLANKIRNIDAFLSSESQKSQEQSAENHAKAAGGDSQFSSSIGQAVGKVFQCANRTKEEVVHKVRETTHETVSNIFQCAGRAKDEVVQKSSEVTHRAERLFNKLSGYC